MRTITFVIAFMFNIILIAFCQAQQKPLWQNNAFAVYADSIVQGNFVARTISASEITSNYQSPSNQFQSPAITFKFSINGKDNEMKSGTDHHFNCIAQNGICETPLIKFGQQFKDETKIAENDYLRPNTKLLIKSDLRDILKAFNKDGYYTTFDGNKIYKEDFKGVYVAGGTAPMVWDFDNLVHHPELKLTDADGDGIYETSLVLNEAKKKKTWLQPGNFRKTFRLFRNTIQSIPYRMPFIIWRWRKCKRLLSQTAPLERVKNGRAYGQGISATALSYPWLTCNRKYPKIVY
jgi:hypothetical protein